MKDEDEIDAADVADDATPQEGSGESFDLLQAPSEDSGQVEILAAPELESNEQADTKQPVTNEEGKKKLFEKYTSKDIVFLSIMAGCMLITSAVMPLALSLHTFGVIHLMLGFQMSFFPALGLMKVKKPGALLYMTVVFSLVPLFIMPPIGLGGLLCALLTEVITIAIFKGYKKDGACLFASALFFPMGLPMMYGYYKILYKGGIPDVDNKGKPIKEAVKAMIDVEPGFAIGISVAIILLCLVGAVLGVMTFRKLKKSGAIKK